jgi:protein-disulfide isomerase
VDRTRARQIASGVAFLAVCAIAVLVVVSQVGGGGSGGDTNLEDVGLVDQQLHGIPQHGTVLGDPKAKVTVTEYGDLQCPVCKGFSESVAPDLIDQVVRKGTASYDFRQWPVIGEPPRTQSTLAAKAALAASEQGRYWNYVELFYRNQGTEDSGYVTDPFMTAIAKGAGVTDIPRWNKDRASAKWDSVLAETNTEAQRLDFSGTPSFEIVGPGGEQSLVGPQSLGDIQAAIQAVE